MEPKVTFHYAERPGEKKEESPVSEPVKTGGHGLSGRDPNSEPWIDYIHVAYIRKNWDKCAEFILAGHDIQEAIALSGFSSPAKTLAGWRNRCPKVVSDAIKTVYKAKRVTTHTLKAKAFDVMESLGDVEDPVKVATVLAKLSEMTKVCEGLDRESKRGELERLPDSALDDEIARLIREVKK